MSSSSSSSSKCPIKLVLGLASVGDESDRQARYTTPETAQQVTEFFRKRGYDHFDTARAYSVAAPGSSERILGQTNLGEWATIDTKVKSFSPGAHSSKGIAESIKASLGALNVSQVNIEYLHAPDRTTPFEETCEAMNQAYQAGRFKLFGLSNYSAQEVEEIVSICEKNGWVKPSVYQGGYNLLTRAAEAELFPVLRKHKIAFYAFSPTAGGFLSGKVNRDTMHNTNGSRWDPSRRTQMGLGRVYTKLYNHDEMFNASEHVQTAAKEAGIGGHAAALRWIIHHSHLKPEFGDAVIFGASSIDQLADNIDDAESGPLPESVVGAIEHVWPKLKSIAPAYHV
ncbi:MAG: hypothetical protein M1816_007334 [Peltula sp. TS41687]|nr:MAG: hypothetical protein M1816_007334 [Peltula sp. TS41687]